MDPERPSISRAGERPVTRWKREQEPSEKSQISERPGTGIVRNYSKMERPTSRRGVKTDITEFGISRPPTRGSNVLSRPPSTSIMSNRVPTPVARIHTMSSASLSRASSGVFRNYVQPNAKVLDRPITQQGLAGIPTSSSKGIPRLTKQIQDKRQYEQMLQQKIKELNEEIEIISQQVEKQNNASIDSDSKRTDSSFELNKLQGQLNDYQNTFDEMVSDSDKEEIIQEARKFKEFADREEIEMQTIFKKYEEAERKLNELNREIESKKKIMGINTDSETKSRYDDLFEEKTEIQKEMNILQNQQNQLSNEKAKMEEKIALAPNKQEAYKLYAKIFQIEQKRDKLLKEKNRSMSEYKEKLSMKSSHESLDVNTAEKQIIEIEKKIADAEKELQQLENNKDEPQLEKVIKTDEPDKPEKIMDIFKSSFEKSKLEELEKLSRLEEEIMEHLDYISNNIDENVESSALMADEMEMLKSIMNQSIENKNKKSIEELKQDNVKLRQILNKLKSIESKIIKETNKANAKRLSSRSTSGDSKIYDSDKEQRKESITKDDELINHKKEDYKSKMMDEHYIKLKEKFEENEIYRAISILEDKLMRISLDDEQVQQFIKEQNESDKQNYSSLLERLVSLTGRYNTFLINEMKSIY